MNDGISDIKALEVVDGVLTLTLDPDYRIYEADIETDTTIKLGTFAITESQARTFELILNYRGGMVTWPKEIDWLNKFTFEPGVSYVFGFRNYRGKTWVANFSHKFGG